MSAVISVMIFVLLFAIIMSATDKKRKLISILYFAVCRLTLETSKYYALSSMQTVFKNGTMTYLKRPNCYLQ